jgi:uncharacterized integral membrane protein
MTQTEHSFRNQKNFNKQTHLGPYWKRMHQDWRFWVGMVLIIVALAIYVMSENFAVQPAAFK